MGKYFLIIELNLILDRVQSSHEFHKQAHLGSIAPLPAKEGAGGRSIIKADTHAMHIGFLRE